MARTLLTGVYGPVGILIIFRGHGDPIKTAYFRVSGDVITRRFTGYGLPDRQISSF